MRGYMFRNRWFALIFVAITLAGVTRLVGTEDDKGAIDAATHQFVEQKAQADQFAAEMSGAEEPEYDVSVEFTADEELIDSATGEDPTPMDDFAAQQSTEDTPEPEVSLVSPSEPDQAVPPQ